MEDLDPETRKIKKEKEESSSGETERGKLLLDIHDTKGNIIHGFIRTVKGNNSITLRQRAPKIITDNKDLVEAVNSNLKDAKPSTSTTSETNINDGDSRNNKIYQYAIYKIIGDSDSDTSPLKIKEQSVSEIIKKPTNIVNETTDQNDDVLQLQKELNDVQLSSDQTGDDYATAFSNIHSSLPYSNRDKTRKYSLDHNILTRRKSWSQSEEQLNLAGKGPLERKRSFFRKRLDKFLKNTSDIFKRKVKQNEQLSLDTTVYTTDAKESISSVSSEESIIVRNDSQCNLFEYELDEQRTSIVSTLSSYGDTRAIYSSEPTVETIGASTTSLAEVSKADVILNPRAISFNSGLDNVKASKKRMDKKANRVTWLASDSVSNYFKKIKKSEDLSDDGEKQSSRWGSWHFPRTTSKSRRLSYQRAVSGEEPTRFRKRKLSVIRPELVTTLAKLRKNGIPPLKTFTMPPIEEHIWSQIDWVATFPDELSLSCKQDDYDTNMLCQQNVIMEFITTESYHIKYMQITMELFLSTALELKSHGFLEDIDLDVIFSNITEVFYATILFWDETIAPMINDAFIKRSSFRLQLMCAGFSHCRETLAPYEKYVTDQSKSIDYLRVLNSNAEFMTYLSWCHTHHQCQRLTLNDMLVKPMQRLTKYELLIGRLLPTSKEDEQVCLRAMETYVKSFVTEINMAVRHIDEMDKFERMVNTVQNYHIDYKDEDLNRTFEANNYLNLRAPVYRCHSSFTRQLIYEGELRYRDNIRETRIGNGFDVRAFLMTDIFMVAKKKTTPVGLYTHKLIRPKFLVSRLDIQVIYKKPSTKSQETKKEIERLIILVKDEVGSSLHCFELTDPKDGSHSLKIWDMKFKEARFAYNLACDASNKKIDCDAETYSEFITRALQQTPVSAEEASIHKDAVERVAVMRFKQRGSSTDQDVSQSSFKTDSVDGEISGRASGLQTVRSPPPPLAVPQSQQHAHGHPPSETSSRNSRGSSFQHSASATSHDDVHICAVDIPRLTPRNMPWQKLKFPWPLSQNIRYEVHERARSTDDVIEEESLGDGDSDIRGRRSPMLQICISSDNDNDVTIHGGTLTPSYSSRTLSPSPNSSVKNLRVKTPEKSMVLSLPNLLGDSLSRSRDPERRNRLSAPPSRPRSANLLSPDRRGTTYPPPSPTNRGALKRGFAFSHSVKNRLTKMGHVSSQSQLTIDGTNPQQNNTIGRMERGGSFTSPTVPPIITPNEILSNPPIASQHISVDNVTQSYPEPSTSSLVTDTENQTETSSSVYDSDGWEKLKMDE